MNEITLEDSIMKLVEEIRFYEIRRMKLIKKILEKNVFSKLKMRIQKLTMDEISVCGVDGGMLQLQLNGLDVVAIRAVAVVFHYLTGRLASVEYFPSGPAPIHFFLVKEPLDKVKTDSLAGMRRQILEVSRAREVIGKGAAQLVLLDGSILPQYVERFQDCREYAEQYDELITSYRRLFEEAESKGVLLAGLVKDSRGKRFCQMLAELAELDGEDKDFLLSYRDIVILDEILSEKERTIAFPYTEEFPPQTLGGLEDFGRKVNVFYARMSQFDVPFRVEFLATRNSEEVADELSSILEFLFSFGFGFSIPPVLVEADFRARLREEAEWIQERVFDVIGPRFLTRRDRRPL
ncbi:MAG: DNA double-strand break repair nuclease NurA [Candidatus Hadarchaeales archaeon]